MVPESPTRVKRREKWLHKKNKNSHVNSRNALKLLPTSVNNSWRNLLSTMLCTLHRRLKRELEYRPTTNSYPAVTLSHLLGCRASSVMFNEQQIKPIKIKTYTEIPSSPPPHQLPCKSLVLLARPTNH